MERANKNQRKTLTDAVGSQYTAKEAAEIVGVSYSTILRWMMDYGYETIEELLSVVPAKHGFSAEQRLLQFVPKEIRRFDRMGVCTRMGGEVVCVHYVSCQDSRMFLKRHHERYCEDGGCFDCGREFAVLGGG